MKKVLTATFAFLMLASLASAQMGHGGPPPAGDFGHGPGGHGGGLLVTSTGTVILISGTYDSATSTSTTTIKAVSSSGAVLWTKTLTNSRGHFTLSGSNLIQVDDSVASDGTVTTTLTAISTATGATAWTKTINGRVMDLTPFSGGTYAIVIVPATTAGGTATRTLVAIGNDGSTLWSVTL